MTLTEKSNIGSLFDGIAAIYDRFNHLSSLGLDLWWRKVAVKTMKRADTMLDVAVGTADLSIAAAKAGKAGSITGIDLSREMLQCGMVKVKRAGLADTIQLIEGSAFDMPFPEGSFDAVTCAYGIRNFSDLDRGLAEMHRVLRQGGELVILEFSYPTNPVVRFFYDLYFSHVMPLIGKALAGGKGGSFTYFIRSVKGFIWGDAMAERLRHAGFRNVEYRTLTFGVTTLYTAWKE